jgi:hypothetical protein
MDSTSDHNPKEFSLWTLEQIRKKGAAMSWMEERRFDWVPIVASAIEHLMGARTMLLVTDRDREWFARYTLTTLNRFNTDRPLLPIISLGTIFPYLDKVNDSEQLKILEDMLSLAFPNDYIFFYIGKGADPRAQIAKGKNDSLLWLLDETAQNAFSLRSDDDELDIKLIQMLKLFDKSIDAILFSEVDIQSVL